MPRTKHKRPYTVAALGVGVFMALMIIGYAAYAAYPMIRGPVLAVAEPEERGGTVVIEGETRRVSRLSINGLDVPITEGGSFVMERAYPVGYTVVVVHAEDRFGTSRERTLTFITNHDVQKEN